MGGRIVCRPRQHLGSARRTETQGYQQEGSLDQLKTEHGGFKSRRSPGAGWWGEKHTFSNLISVIDHLSFCPLSLLFDFSIASPHTYARAYCKEEWTLLQTILKHTIRADPMDSLSRPNTEAGFFFSFPCYDLTLPPT